MSLPAKVQHCRRKTHWEKRVQNFKPKSLFRMKVAICKHWTKSIDKDGHAKLRFGEASSPPIPLSRARIECAHSQQCSVTWNVNKHGLRHGSGELSYIFPIMWFDQIFFWAKNSNLHFYWKLSYFGCKHMSFL